MKKNILLIVLTITIGLVKAQNTLTIGIVNDQHSPESASLLNQLQSEIKSVLGQGTTVNFTEVLFNNHSLETAKENYTALLDDNTDIIIAFGVINTIMLYQEESYNKPTLIVGAINNDIVNIPKDKKTSGINNLTYLITPFSYKEDLDAFAGILPFKKIGIVVDDFILTHLPLMNLFDEYFANKSASYEFITLTINSYPASLFDDIDAVYLVSHSNLEKATFEEMIASINNLKLASMSAYGVRDVESGVLTTNQPKTNFDQIFRRIALDVESINNGTNASSLPLIIDYTKGLSINMATAEQIEFPIKNSMLATVNLIEGTSYVDAQYTYSLKEVMNEVVSANLTLNAERKNILLSEQDLRLSKSQYLPDVIANLNGAYIDPKVAEISNGENPELSTAGNLSLNQVLYSEQATANISIQKSLLNAQKEDYNASELDALLNASVAYFNALILKTNVSIQNKNLQVTRQNLEIANQNLELGASGKSDVLRFKSQLSQNTLSMIEARNALSQAYYQINQLLNNPISNKISIEDTLIATGKFQNASYDYLIKTLDDPKERYLLIEFLIDEAMRNAPELKNFDYNIDAVVRNYRLNDYGRFIPTLALQGQYNYAFSRSGVGSETPSGFPSIPDGKYNIGLNLSLPIFQQNQRNINRQSTRVQEDQLIIQKDNVKLSIEKNMNDIVLDLINEIANIEISAVNLIFSEESLDLSQNEYRNGAIPVIQLIDAQSNYVKAYLSNATAKYNYLLVSMQLQRVMGLFFLINSDTNNQEFIQRASQFILNNN